MEKNTRREFISKSTAAVAGVSVGLHAFGSKQTSKIFGANDKIRVGFVGVGNRGSQLLERFMANKDVEVAALCDVYQPYTGRDRSKVSKRFLEMDRIPQMGEKFAREVQQFSDYRKMFEMKDLDAVCIATPDHWHALQCIDACIAGLDVYVEKPLTITIKEGRAMVNAQKSTRNVVQVGLNRRGSVVYQKLVNDGLIQKTGKILSASAFRISNMFPDGIGRLNPETPPNDFNWDMWLGPRAARPFQYNIAPYYFRWWSDYSTQMGNWGVHYMDVIRWLAGETAPSAISAHGGKYVLTDDRDIPDTMDVLFEFNSGMIIKFSIYEGTSGNGIAGGEIELNGTKGSLVASENGFEFKPSRPGQFQKWKQLAEPEQYDLRKDPENSENRDSTARLIRNFLDCIKTRETPWCTLEDGHRSTSFAHLANIALKTGKRLEWNAEKEIFTNCAEANELLHYEYRKPWKLAEFKRKKLKGMQSRRSFIKCSATGAAAFGIAGPVWAGKMVATEIKRPIHVFTKCLQFLNYEKMAEVLAEHGFAGADMTVRPGGQILPENVETDLPKAIKALRNAGIDSKMITTSVNNPEDKFTRPILKTMAELGIRYYRTGYLEYDHFKSIPENLEAHKTTFEKLEKLNREYGLTGNYQNHSGRRVGGPVWDLYELLKDRDPEYIGVQYDIRHASVEGGVSWPLGLRLLAPWIRTTDIKDFIWEKNEKGEWKIKNVPLGEGMVDFKSYFELYKSLGIEGPVSIHYEYDLGGAEHGSRNPDMPLVEISKWLKKDLVFLRKQFQQYSL